MLVHGFALGEHDSLRLLSEWNGGCQPPWSEAELVHKVKSAANAQHSERRGYLLQDGEAPSGRKAKGDRILQNFPPPKPTFFPMVLKRVAAKVEKIGNVVEFIRERSPIAVEGETSLSVLRHLYPPG